MIEVTLGQIEDSAATLMKIASNAKMPPILFIKFTNASRDVKEQIETLNQLRQDAIDEHTMIFGSHTGTGEVQHTNEFIDTDHRSLFNKRIREIRNTKVQLNRSRYIEWKTIEDSKIEISPMDVALLDWLITLPEET